MPFINPAQGAELLHVTPRPTQTLFNDNYLSFDGGSATGDTNSFAAQFLPEIYEKEIERFGKRTISGFLNMVGAEMPMASDQVIWSEQGRLHIAYEAAATVVCASATTITVPANNQIQNHDTIVVATADNAKVLKCLVIGGGGTSTITVSPYTQLNLTNASSGAVNFTVSGGSADQVNIFVYGTEYRKGSDETTRSMDASFTQFSNKPIIIRDRYQVNGSDTAQIGWVEVTSENGASGYLWYLKSEHESRLRFSDYLEMAVIEGVPAAANMVGTGQYDVGGTDGLFYALEQRGLVWTGTDFEAYNTSASATTGGIGASLGMIEFDTILQELDKQGAIEENMMFLNRATSLEIDNMLASQNTHGAGGSSYGVFNNSEDMALNLGFSGFRRGSYDFYKTDWKYLNDSVTRGLVGDVEGVIVPAGTSTVYDESMGKNVKRPFLHIRYRASEADDRKLKSWITGSVGGNYTSAVDEMVVNYLSERCLCVQGANNFVLLKA
jgi:hypothetical protein